MSDSVDNTPPQRVSGSMNNPLVSGDLNEMFQWIVSNGVPGSIKQLTLDEMLPVPTHEDDVRSIQFLRLKTEALEKAGLAFYISNSLADRYEYISPQFRELFFLSEEDAA
jgi:hypothetical protein